MLAVQPTRQFVTIEQVSGLAVFLCTDAAASITGTACPSTVAGRPSEPIHSGVSTSLRSLKAKPA
jgi:hypothetical protein